MQNKTQNKNTEIKLDFIDKLAESPAKLIPAAFLTVMAAGVCVWLISFALDAQASKLDKKLEQQQFYNIIKTTYRQ
jgi:hypothetical protein